MTQRLSRDARDVLKRGTFCLLAAFPGDRVHLTPVVYVVDGGRIWLTTSRTSVKARAWRRDPRTAGLVERDGLAVAFRGVCRSFDLLDPGTWAASAIRSPAITRAATRFTVKNARFFAGYARDAHRVPLSWTPPARVFTSIEVDAAALLDVGAGTVVERWGAWPDDITPADSYRVARPRSAPTLPADVTSAVRTGGEGAVGLLGSVPAVLPCRWWGEGGRYVAAVPAAHLRLAGAAAESPAALTVQHPSAWRAREMRGVLAEGRGSVHLPSRTRTGRAALDRDLARAKGEADRDALVRLRPERLIWWSGWTAGTVAP